MTSDAEHIWPTLSAFLVEDSATIRENLIATLEELTPVLVIGTADHEAAALTWLTAHHGECGLVIIDIFLKSGSGLAVLRHTRELAPLLPLIVLSNYATAAMTQRCIDQGATRVFDKSTQLEAMLLFCSELAKAPRPSVAGD